MSVYRTNTRTKYKLSSTVHNLLISSILNSNFIYLCAEYQCFHIFLCLKFYFPSLFFPAYLFHAVNFHLSHSRYFCIHKFRGFPFLRLPGGHHPNIFRRTLSSSILCTWPYQFNCLYLI